MSAVRVLVGTRKGAFVLTSDAKRKSWDVRGPTSPGGRCTTSTGRRPTRRACTRRSPPAGSDRSSSAQTTAARRGIRSTTTSSTTVCRDPSVVRRDAAPVGVRQSLAPRAVVDRPGRRLRGSRGRRALPLRRRRPRLARAVRAARTRVGLLVAAGCRWDVPAYDRAGPELAGPDLRGDLGRRRVPQRRRRRHLAPHEPWAEIRGDPRRRCGGRSLRSPHRAAPRSGQKCSTCKSTGT